MHLKGKGFHLVSRKDVILGTTSQRGLLCDEKAESVNHIILCQFAAITWQQVTTGMHVEEMQITFGDT